MSPPVPEAVYDAAMRLIRREPLPGDINVLERWYAERTSRTYREISLEVIRQASEAGISPPA